MCSYCCTFIPNYAYIERPLLDLTEGKVHSALQWTPDAEQSSHSLMLTLQCPPTLGIPDRTGPFTAGTGGILLSLGKNHVLVLGKDRGRLVTFSHNTYLFGIRKWLVPPGFKQGTRHFRCSPQLSSFLLLICFIVSLAYVFWMDVQMLRRYTFQLDYANCKYSIFTGPK